MTEKDIFYFIKHELLLFQSKKNKPLRIAINGIEGTGKTEFAKKLTNYLNAEKIKTIHVSIDGYHNNKKIRYRQGEYSAKGYYEDSYNELAFVENVLKLSQLDNPSYISAIHDIQTDEYLDLAPIELDNDTVLIADGAYLFKPNYIEHWDLKIYLKTSFKIAMSRGIERDKNMLGGYEITKEKFKKRYHKASKIYIDNCEPERIADVIIDNSNFENLKLTKNSFSTSL